MARLLSFAHQRRADRFLLLSSGAVYGYQPAEILSMTESYPGAPDPLDPGEAYGHMKRAAELLGCALAQEGQTAFLIARGFAFLGPHMAMGSAMGVMLAGAIGRGQVVLDGDGTPVRTYMYGSDFTVWAWAILSRGRSSYPYNVGSPEPQSLAEVAALVRNRWAPGSLLAFKNLPQWQSPRRRYVPSVDRAAMELGLNLSVPLDEAVDRTGRWLHDHRHTLGF
jgi:dTDP-glucose 4,6-dehydratase